MKQLSPFFPAELDLKISSMVERKFNELTVTFIFKGDLKKIIIPTQTSSPQYRDELWKTTCLEIFFGLKKREEYWEMNISPSGDRNCYHFDKYRHGMKRDVRLDISSFKASLEMDQAKWVFEIDISRLNLSAEMTRDLEFSTTCVVEDLKGSISYWAINHEGKTPDFHLRKSFKST